MHGVKALQAYKKSATHRGIREQEADIFFRVNAILRSVSDPHTMAGVKALADNDRLWITLLDVLADPSNALPLETRAKLISIGRAVRREHASPDPDLSFLIGVNAQIAAGLSGL